MWNEKEVLIVLHGLARSMDYINQTTRDLRNGKVWYILDAGSSGKGQVTGSCDNYDKISGSIKGQEIS